MSGLDLLSAFILSPLLLVAFGTTYHVFASCFATEKQRAYILSTVSSAIMSLVSLPFVWTYLRYGLVGMYQAGQDGWLSHIGRFGVIFFGNYLFADLCIGYFRYPSQVGLVTGWIHHTCYIGIMVYCLNTTHYPCFLVAGIMELPTLDLALSNLFPQLRNDLRFLISFFIIRIAYNAYLMGDSLRPSVRAMLDGTWIPHIMLAMAGILHLMWFNGGVRGYLKRQKVARKARTVSDKVVDPVETLLDSQGNPAGSAPDRLSSNPGTPQDSPLVTPYTPGTTPMTLRDSYLFPNLSNLPTVSIPAISSVSIPNIPSMPTFADFTAALPKSLAPENMTFAFKDAVRNRWEEQRGRFEQARGRGMGLTLGGLGLRRRGNAEGDVAAVTDDTKVE